MKYKGKTLVGPPEVIHAVPRASTIENEIEVNNDIIFKLRAVADMDVFEQIVPAPLPPEVVRPGNIRSKNLEDPTYKQQLSEWNLKRTDWLILKTMEGTTDIEWQTVKLDDPDSWSNFRQELGDSGFNRVEILLLCNEALRVNSVDPEKMEAARARFLASEASANQSNFQKAVP